MKPIHVLLWLFAVLLLVVIAALAVRAMRALQGPPLQPWHTHVPVELSAQQMDASDWQGYLAQERVIFDDIRATRKSDFINAFWRYIAFDAELLERTVESPAARSSSVRPTPYEAENEHLRSLAHAEREIDADAESLAAADAPPEAFE